MQTMGEWFGLKEGHHDFSIENDADASLFFARHELQDELHSILRRSFRTHNPPKLVLYGDWGVGKTHTMRHIQHVIEHSDDYRAYVVFVELPDINSKSTFQVAHAALCDAIGFDKAKRWVLAFQTQEENAHALIQEATQSGDIATAFANLLAMGEGGRIAWDWLRGFSLSASDSRLVGLPQALVQSNQLVKVLQMLGKLCAAVEDKLLVMMLDEATKLGAVSNQDCINHWINAMKLISDPLTKDFGFIVSGSWVDPDDMALPLQDQQIVTRFGSHNYIPLTRLREDEAKEFVKDLLGVWIDEPKRDRKIAAFDAQRDGESLDPSTYPFTSDGLDVAVQWICIEGSVTTPRDIQKKLDDLFNNAMDDSRTILSASYIHSRLNG